jgi:hypothetical protein
MQGELQKTLEGHYTNPATNPHLLPLADQIMAKVRPQIEARFAGAGAGRSGLASRAVSEGMTDALASAAQKNYENERNRQMQAMMFAPQAANQDYMDIAKLSEVGGVREDLAQQGINEQMQRFQFENMAPWEQLGLYNQMIQGTYGGTRTTNQTPQRRSLGANMLGGGLLGGALGYGNLGFQNPWSGAGAGAGIGAGAMGLLGGLMR